MFRATSESTKHIKSVLYPLFFTGLCLLCKNIVFDFWAFGHIFGDFDCKRHFNVIFANTLQTITSKAYFFQLCLVAGSMLVFAYWSAWLLLRYCFSHVYLKSVSNQYQGSTRADQDVKLIVKSVPKRYPSSTYIKTYPKRAFFGAAWVLLWSCFFDESYQHLRLLRWYLGTGFDIKAILGTAFCIHVKSST